MQLNGKVFCKKYVNAVFGNISKVTVGTKPTSFLITQPKIIHCFSGILQGFLFLIFPNSTTFHILS